VGEVEQEADETGERGWEINEHYECERYVIEWVREPARRAE